MSRAWHPTRMLVAGVLRAYSTDPDTNPDSQVSEICAENNRELS